MDDQDKRSATASPEPKRNHVRNSLAPASGHSDQQVRRATDQLPESRRERWSEPTGQGVAAEVDVEARLLDEAANNNRASAKYSNFMMEGGDADHQRTSGELLPSGREQVFDYAAEENGAEPSEREDEGHGGQEQPSQNVAQEASALAKMIPGGGGEFRPFAGLDDLEPIEKKSQYSDDNDDDAIADEHQNTSGAAVEEGEQINGDHRGVPPQIETCDRARDDDVGHQNEREDEELSEIVNSKQSSDEQMGPFFDDEQLKLDFFGKQAVDHRRGGEAYTRSGEKQAMREDKAAVVVQEQVSPHNTGKKTKEKKKEVDKQDGQQHLQRRDPDKLMVNNFIMGNGNNNSSSVPQYNNQNIEDSKVLDRPESGRSPNHNNTRDIHFLMERYKEDNKGQGTTDICLLFSYWQANFCYNRPGSTDEGTSVSASANGAAPGILGPGPSQSNSNNMNTIKSSIAMMHDDKTSSFINYNSKSFNNKTYYNNDARTTPNQNNTDEEEDGGNFMRSREEQQCGRIGVTASMEPSPIPQARVMPGRIVGEGDAVDGHHYARDTYHMEIIDNEFEAPNIGSNDEQQYQQLIQNQQLQLSELKGSIASPNTNLHTIGSMDGDFNPKTINLNNQRIHHQQNKEKKHRVQVPKIEFNNNFAQQPGANKDKRANNIQMQISQISQLSQISNSAGHQFGNSGPMTGSNANTNGFVFQREASNSLQKNIRQHSDSRQGQVDSILFSQKIKLDREKNINEIQLGNVKNQVLGGASGGGHHHQGSLLQNSSIGGPHQNAQNSLLPQNMLYNNNAVNFSGGSIGLIAGREIDRNQLSVEIMNITPIMEEKEYYHNAHNNYGLGGHGELNEFKIDDEPEEESGDTAGSDGQRNKTKANHKIIQDENIQDKIHEHGVPNDEDQQQLNDEQNQFSFDKELNYFNPDAHGGQTSQKKHFHYDGEKPLEDKSRSPGAGRRASLQQQQADDLSELMDLEEKILVKNLEQIDQRFSIDKIARSPQKSSKSSKRKNRSDRAKNIFRHMDDNYSSINFISNSEQTMYINLFVGNKIFGGGAGVGESKLLQRERRRFENNCLLLRRDFRVYNRLLESQKLVNQVFGSLQLMRLSQNIPFVYHFKHLDVKSSVFMNKLPQELANLNELSPILDKKHADGVAAQDWAPFSHLQLILSQSITGLCRQYLILHSLLKGLKMGIDFATQTDWLKQLAQACREEGGSDPSQQSSWQLYAQTWLKDLLNSQFCRVQMVPRLLTEAGDRPEEYLGNFQGVIGPPEGRSSHQHEAGANAILCQQYFTLHKSNFETKRKKTTSSAHASNIGETPPSINFLGQKILSFKEEEKDDDLGLQKEGQEAGLVIGQMGRSVERPKAGNIDNLESGRALRDSGGSSPRVSAGRAGGGNRHSSGRRGLGEQHATRSAAVFDHLSSIDSEGHAAPYEGDGDEGDVLEVLQRTTQYLNGAAGATNLGKEKQGGLFADHQGDAKADTQGVHHRRLLKNDDTEYKERERKNLSKYRDRSEFSANSDLAAFNQINRAEAPDRQGSGGNMLLAGESKNQVQDSFVKQSSENKGQAAGGQPPSSAWVDYKRGRLRKNRKVRNNKKEGNEDKGKGALGIKDAGEESNTMLFKTPDEKQHHIQGGPVPQLAMKSKFPGLNTTPNDKNRDEGKISKTRRTNKSKSNNKHRARHGSSKSKSKSRFSNNLGFAQLQNAIENEEIDALENTQEIEKLLQAIDDGKNELDKFISREEENYTKKFNNKVSEAERVLQNSRRDGSTNNRCGADSYRGALNFGSGIVVNRDQSQTQRLGPGITDNLQQNQHHNSISNNSGSFYFPLSKKQGGRDGLGAVNRTNIKSNNISMHQNHPYNPRGANSGSIYGLSGKKERNSEGGHDGGFCASSSNSSSSSSSSRNNIVSCGDKSQNLKSISDIENKAGGSQIKNIQLKNVSTHQIYSQNSQLLTDRPNFDKKLDLGRLRNNLGNRHGGRQHNAAGGIGIFADKSNERQMSIVSGNSKYSNGNTGGGGHHYNVHNSSYTNRQRFPFNNNLVNRSSAAVGNYQHHNYSNLQHNQQYSSLSRIGLQKISSGMSGGGYSNQSPSNGHNFVSQNKLATAIHEINEGQKNSTRRSGVNNMMLLEHTNNTRQNTSGFLANVNNNFQSTQNSYRTTTNQPPSSASANQNPILLKLKTTQMSRGGGGGSGAAAGSHGMAATSSNVYQGGSGAGAATPGQIQTLTAAIGNSMMLQTTSDYPLSQRGAPHHHSSMHSSITPKSFGGARGSGLLGPGETSQGGRNASNLLQGVSPKKQMLNTQQKHTMQPILGQINLERSQTIGQSQRQGQKQRGTNAGDHVEDAEMEDMIAGGDHLEHDQILETEQLEQAHEQINIIDNELLEQDADDYDKQILIKQNTDQQFDEFKVASKAQRQTQGKGDRSADAVEGNFDQKYLRDTSSMSRNDSKEKVKKSVLSIKMLRATATSFYGGHGGSSSIAGANGAQSSRLPGINGLNGQNATDGRAGADRKAHIQQTNSQIKLRVKSLKKGDNTLISTSNLNSSVSKASAEKIRTSSNSSMGTSGARKLRLKFKPRNFNSKQGDGEQKRSGDDQQDKGSSHLDEGTSALGHGSQAQHLQSQEQSKVQSARSGIKALDKRRDRVARGQRGQAAQDGVAGAKQPPGTAGSSAAASHQASKASLVTQNPPGSNRHHQDSIKQKDGHSAQNSQQHQRGGPRSRLKQPSYTNLKGHTGIRGGPNLDGHKSNDGYASKFRGRDRDVKKDNSPQLKKQHGRDKAEQDYQQLEDKLLNNSLDKQQQQQHKTLVQHHYYAAASMAQQHQPQGQTSARSNQRLTGGQASRRTGLNAQTALQMGDSVSPQVASRLHLSQHEQDNSLQQAQQQSHNLTSVSYKNNQRQNQTIMQGNQDDMAQKFQTASGTSGARIGQTHKQAREAQVAKPSPKNDRDRLIELLVGEFKRKKGRNIRADVPAPLQLQTLLSFWHESLSKQRILTKLRVKQQQSFSAANMNSQADTMRTTTSLPSKLSDKEKWLLNFLQGTDPQQLLTLGKESTTRNYGELAMIDERTLAQEICRFLKLDPQSQELAATPSARDRPSNNIHPAHQDGNSHPRGAADHHAGAHAGGHHQQHLPEQQQRAMYSMHGSRAQLGQSAMTAQASRNQGRPTPSHTHSAQVDSVMQASGPATTAMGMQGQAHGTSTMASQRHMASTNSQASAAANTMNSSITGRMMPHGAHSKQPGYGHAQHGSHPNIASNSGSSGPPHSRQGPAGQPMARPSAL